MSAVSKDGFAGVEGDFFFGPIDEIADAIGDVNFASCEKANERGVLNAEVGIMMSNDGVGESRLEFVAAMRATGNDGVRIDGAGSGERDLGRVRKEAGEVEEGEIGVVGRWGNGRGRSSRWDRGKDRSDQ